MPDAIAGLIDELRTNGERSRILREQIRALEFELERRHAEALSLYDRRRAILREIDRSTKPCDDSPDSETCSSD